MVLREGVYGWGGQWGGRGEVKIPRVVSGEEDRLVFRDGFGMEWVVD